MFRDAGVRSWFDWDRLELGQYSVIEQFSQSKFLLGELQTVWYLSHDGQPGDWRNQADRRVSVAEAARLPAFPSDDSSAYIERLAAQIMEPRDPRPLVLPCYRTEAGASLILDGNHRAVAAFKARRDIRLLVFSIGGTDDPLLLPDLIHDIGGEMSPAAWDAWRIKIERQFASR